MSVSMLPIALDAMGGDHGAHVVVEGALQAAHVLGIHSIIVGDEGVIRDSLRELNAEADSFLQVCHAPDHIRMDESPALALRAKPDSSIIKAFRLVKEGKAAAVVSPGNTGAVMAAGVYQLGVLPGVARPAIASLIPRAGGLPPVVLLDSGANVDCRAEQLVQFAVMGDYYARTIGLTARPRVAILSNGSENSKGNDVTRAAALMLSEVASLNFIGFVEGHDVPHDVADVVVCDGFVGNVLLKTVEGSVNLVFDSLKSNVENTARGKLGMWLMRPAMRKLFGETLNPSAYGGAPLMGLNGVAIICHGAACSRAIMNGLKVARSLADDDLASKLTSAFPAMDSGLDGSCAETLWDKLENRFRGKRSILARGLRKEKGEL